MIQDLNQKVLLLAIYKKESYESLEDVIIRLSNTGMFSPKEGRIFLKLLKKNKFVDGEELTMMGESEAKKIEAEFQL